MLSDFKKIIGLDGNVKKFIIMGLVLFPLFELLKLVPPYLYKIIIDELVAGASSFETVLVILLGYFAAHFTLTIFDVIGVYVFFRKINQSDRSIVLHSIRKLLSLDLSYHEVNNTGTLLSKLLRGSGRLVDMLHNLKEGFFPVIFQTLFTVIALFYIHWYIGASFLFFLPLFLVLLVYDSIKSQRLREEFHQHFEEFSSTATQAIRNVRTVKDFHTIEKEMAKADNCMDRFEDAWFRRNKQGTRNLLVQDTLVNIGRIGTLILCIWLYFEQAISAGGLVFVMTLTEKAYINMARLSRVFYRILDALPSVDRFHLLFNEQINVNEGNKECVIGDGAIAFDNVTFSYDGTQKALRNVSFEIAPKSVVAVVGRSGSGKSTMIKLLLRHYDINTGSIKIDGNDVRDYSFGNLRNGIALVSQEVELFDSSIRENITYGLDTFSEKEVIKAAKLANAHQFILQFKEGYNTVIGENGIKLSGGQKQRLAIARAILRKPKLLIFDEATSALDSESENLIHKSIGNLIGKVTLIIIAHRFATIEHAEKILLFEHGKLIETGTHKELMKKGGIFKKLRKLQELGDVN